MPTFQDLGLVLSAVLLGLSTVAIFVIRRLNGSATLNLKLGMTALWIYALLRMYSASSYIWGPSVPSEAWDYLRAGVLAALTAILIIILGLLAFYWRRMHR